MNNQIEKQEYKVLARKYRPQTFKDLIGQETLVQTLTNAILNNRIAHAYLLTGVRGVGKTTTARLIAMSLTCEKKNLNSCEPCGKCESCISTREDRNLDVIEMDAASKTGVDDIREIIENVKYKPLKSNYKIFIIDEVHMLSKNAFNALLKTLEEPPAHIKFIFATTEVIKIPITVISRCQRFDLHRIETKKLTDHLLNISKKENIKIDLDAIILIVRAADGSVRDGLSLLDQSIANMQDHISSVNVIKMLGLADRGMIFELMESIFQGKAVNALEIYNRMHEAGAGVVMIFDEMLNIVHLITQIKIAPKIKNDLQLPQLERDRGSEIAQKISMSSLGMIWQVLFKGYEELQSGFHLYQHGEMIILRLIYLYNGPTPDELIKKTNQENISLQNKTVTKTLDISQSSNNQEFNNNFNKKNKSEKKNNDNDFNQSETFNSQNSFSIKSYREFVDLFYQKKEGMLHTYLYNNIKPIFFKEGELEINAEKIIDPNFTRTISKLISKWTGRIWQISTTSSNLGKTLYEEDLINQHKEIEIMQNDPLVKNLLDTFPGSKINSITNINQTSDEKDFFKKNTQTKEK